MASTYSTNLRLELIGTGEQQGTWGLTTNTNLGTLLEEAIGGYVAVPVTDGVDTVLTVSNGAADQSRNMTLNLTGALTASRNVIAPAIEKIYIVKNSTTGGFAVTLKVSGQTGVSIPNGATYLVYVNGTDVIQASGMVTAGGTGITSYTTGDLLYASGATTLAKLADVATGNALISGGVGVAPSWGKVDLTTHISGTLPVANGGTGVTTSTGSGSVVLSTSPTLTTPNLGTPSAATLTNATGLPLTTGVTGTLPVANGGTGVTTSTGSGSVVLSTSPVLTTPNLGTPSAATLTNATGLPLTTGVTGTLAVSNGGTGATTLTGIVKGNGTSAFSAAVAGTDYAGINNNNTFTVSQNITTASGNSSLVITANGAGGIAIVSVTNPSGGGDLQQNGNDMFLSNYNASGTMYFRTGGNSTARLTISNAGVITTTGNVGIGVSPTASLDAIGNIRTRANFLVPNTNGIQLGDDIASGFISYGYSSTRTNTAGHRWYNGLTTEVMRIDTSGNVGIGTLSPGQKLDVIGTIRASAAVGVGDSSVNLSGTIVNESDTSKSISLTADPGGVGANSFIGFKVDGQERMRVDSSGNVGIGTNTQSDKLVIAGSTSDTWAANSAGLSINGNAGASGISVISTYLDTTSIRIGAGVTQKTGLLITGQTSASGSTVQFSTGGNERMRVDSNGNVGIGTNSPATLLHVNGTIRYTNRPAAGTITAIGYDSNGDLKNSSSSLRYKHDVKDYEKGLDVVMGLRPVTFKFNGEDRTNSGFIAEEIDAAGLPEVMLYDEQGRPDGVLYANMVALLTKAIQDLKSELDSYKASHP